MEHFQSLLIIRDLHNYKGVPYESHMLLYEHGIVNQKLRPHDSML